VVRIGSSSSFSRATAANPFTFTSLESEKLPSLWLDPVRLEYNHGFAPTELNKIEGIVRDHEAQLQQAWHDYFKSGN
jgi:hypothetical protein